MVNIWRGPVALAVYIPYPAHTYNGDSCRTRILKYVQDMTRKVDAPFALSFMYANELQLTLHCNINMNSTGLEHAWVNKAGIERRFLDKRNNYLNLWDNLYPVNHARNLGISMARPG